MRSCRLLAPARLTLCCRPLPPRRATHAGLRAHHAHRAAATRSARAGPRPARPPPAPPLGAGSGDGELPAITATARRRPRAQPSARVAGRCERAAPPPAGAAPTARVPLRRQRRQATVVCTPAQRAGGGALSALRRGGGMRLALGLLAHGPLATVRPPPSPPPPPALPLCSACTSSFLSGARLNLPACSHRSPCRHGARRTNVATALPLAVRLAPRATAARPPRLAPRSRFVPCAAVCDAQVQGARRSARARRRRNGRAPPPPLCCKVRPRRYARLACLCPCTVVSPRLAPSLDLTDAVTLFQALHVQVRRRRREHRRAMLDAPTSAP